MRARFRVRRRPRPLRPGRGVLPRAVRLVRRLAGPRHRPPAAEPLLPMTVLCVMDELEFLRRVRGTPSPVPPPAVLDRG
ncbi:hypothetical protein ABZ883_18645 [Streptomyces sp. NPDC046977]|uniref:hypothetical protein n=1 Tax=Streptomyces sp. NPDC046977 TaxID=3154703 RepID=UPI0033E4C53A